MSAYSTPALKQILKKPPQTSDELELFVQQYPTREVPVDDFRVCLQLTHPSEWKAWGPFLQNPPQVEPRQRSSALCMHDGKLLCLQAHDPDTGVRYIFPPGGGVEPGEEPWHAAMRETLEETGFHVAVPHTSTLIASYLFPWNRHVYWVTTHFFAATLSHKEREILIENDPGMDEVCWINLENIPAAFVFNNHIRTAIEAAITRILRSGRNE